MSRLIALAGLFSVSTIFALSAAQGDQMFPSTAPSGAFHGCDGPALRCGTHFEGYVVVRRHDPAAPAPAHADAVLSANRLYLPASDDKAP